MKHLVIALLIGLVIVSGCTSPEPKPITPPTLEVFAEQQPQKKSSLYIDEDSVIWGDSLDIDEQEFKKTFGGITQVTGRYILRKTAKSEIILYKNPTEAKLKAYLLGSYWDEEKIPIIRDILNKPWDKKGIDYILSDIMGSKSSDAFTEGHLLDLLAYTATNHEDMRSIIKNIINDLVSKMRMEENKTNGKSQLIEWTFLTKAISEYGSLYLITPNMIERVQEEEVAKNSGSILCWPLLGIFKTHPCQEGIDKLRELSATASWPKDDARRAGIKDAISYIQLLMTYPILEVITKTYNVKDLAEEANKLKGTQEDRVKFLEQKIKEKADQLLKDAKEYGEKNDVRGQRLLTKQAKEIMNRLKEWQEKNK